VPNYRHTQNLLIGSSVVRFRSRPLDKLFFAIMAGCLVFLLAMSAYIVSL
jgi:energy-converting hydrogenase Eha subunit C